MSRLIGEPLTNYAEQDFICPLAVIDYHASRMTSLTVHQRKHQEEFIAWLKADGFR